MACSSTTRAQEFRVWNVTTLSLKVQAAMPLEDPLVNTSQASSKGSLLIIRGNITACDLKN